MLARKGDAAASNCVLGKYSRAATGAPSPSPSLTRFVSVGQVNARLVCVCVGVDVSVCWPDSTVPYKNKLQLICVGGVFCVRVCAAGVRV